MYSLLFIMGNLRFLQIIILSLNIVSYFKLKRLLKHKPVIQIDRNFSYYTMEHIRLTGISSIFSEEFEF